jgi:hypothetical protein
MKTALPTIRNCRKGIMGTVCFDGQFPGMRKPQEFIVYPMQDSGTVITIQSDTRIAQLDLDTGKLLLSESRPNGAYFVHLQIGKRTVHALPAEDVQTLRGWIRATGGVEVGESFVKSDNTGALAL